MRQGFIGGVSRSVRGLQSEADRCRDVVVEVAQSVNHSRNGLAAAMQGLERTVHNATESVKQQAAESGAACGAAAEVETYGINVEASLRVDTAIAAQMETSAAGTSIAFAESVAYGNGGTKWVDKNAVTSNGTRSVLTLRLQSGAYVERCAPTPAYPTLEPSATSLKRFSSNKSAHKHLRSGLGTRLSPPPTRHGAIQLPGSLARLTRRAVPLGS